MKKGEIQARVTVYDFDKITASKKEFMIKWLRLLASELKKHKKGELSKIFRSTLYK